MATGLSKQPTRDKLYAKYRKGPDLELHIKVTWIDGLEFVNLRNYVPSTKEYGKGVLFPSHMLPWIVEELGELQRLIGTSGARPGVGQQNLAV